MKYVEGQPSILPPIPRSPSNATRRLQALLHLAPTLAGAQRPRSHWNLAVGQVFSVLLSSSLKITCTVVACGSSFRETPFGDEPRKGDTCLDLICGGSNVDSQDCRSMTISWTSSDRCFYQGPPDNRPAQCNETNSSQCGAIPRDDICCAEGSESDSCGECCPQVTTTSTQPDITTTTTRKVTTTTKTTTRKPYNYFRRTRRTRREHRREHRRHRRWDRRHGRQYRYYSGQYRYDSQPNGQGRYDNEPRSRFRSGRQGIVRRSLQQWPWVANVNNRTLLHVSVTQMNRRLNEYWFS